MNTFCKYLRARRTAPLYVLGWQGAFFLLGVLMVVIINAFVNDDPDYATMGTLMSMCGALGGTMVQGNMTGAVRFRIAVSMGQTRRSYILCDTVFQALLSAFAMVVAFCLNLAEKGLYRLLYPTYTLDLDPGQYVFQWKAVLGIVVLLTLLPFIFTGVTQRFGVKAFGIVWMVFCFGFMLIPQSIVQATDGGTSLFAKLGSGILFVMHLLSPVGWVCVGVAVLLAGVALSARWLVRAEVRM